MDGDYLDFFRVIPTYSDRKPFYISILDVEGQTKAQDECLITWCKNFFVRQIEELKEPYQLEMVLNQSLINL
jgi:hypothetical protein